MRRMLSAVLLATVILAVAGCGRLCKRPQAPPAEAGSAVRSEVPAASEAQAPTPPTTAPEPPQPSAIAILAPESYEKAKALHMRGLTGTAGGGMGAGDVGYYLDVLEARLRQRLGGMAIGIERTDRGHIVLRLAGRTVFEPKRSRLDAGALELLAAIARILDEFRLTLVTIHGHTDDVGEEAFNRHLSELRALSVARYLADAGVAVPRLVIVGHGESQPVASNATPEGQDRNRRVDLQLEPITP